MSLFPRQPRPLKRDETRLRDDRLFIVACDDTYAPKQYFDFFQIPRVHVHIVPTVDGTSAARHVLERLLQIEHEEDDERWMLLDTDHYTGLGLSPAMERQPDPQPGVQTMGRDAGSRSAPCLQAG